jgi:TRAP-type C4-dicarboxylate transport system permease small subunit
MSETAPAARRGIARLMLDGLDWVAASVVILAMAGMIAIVATQVGLRYGLNQSIDWADEVSRLLFVWAVFMAIPLGIARGGHIGIDLLTDRLPIGLRGRLFAVVDVLAVVLLAVVGGYAARLTYDQWDEPMSTLDLSVGLFMLPIVIGAAHSILHLLMQVVAGRPVRTRTLSEPAARE